MKVEAKIQKWGNSLALRLTGPVRSVPHFEADMMVIINVTKSGIRVEPMEKPKKKERFTEEQLLKGLNAHTAHADLLAEISLEDIERDS